MLISCVISKSKDVGYFKTFPFISSLKAMDNIVNRYYSTKEVDCNLEKHVNELCKAVAAVEIFD